MLLLLNSILYVKRDEYIHDPEAHTEREKDEDELHSKTAILPY